MVDWQALLEPHHVLENVVRATLIYWMLFLLLRLLPNRKTGGIGPTDLLVVVLLANAVQTAMMRDSTAITDAAIQVFTIIGWSTAFDVLGSHVPFLRPVIHSAPVEVVRDGEVLKRNLRREFLTEEELDAQLRLQHVDDVSDVAHAYVEHDGRVSVIRRRDQAQGGRKTTTPKDRSAA
ncbi:MAG: DUF421 domain-containing protein [Chloroflexota bacterium]|nr:DUF421 domain-containing protein [Chloroflexota bacterium]